MGKAFLMVGVIHCLSARRLQTAGDMCAVFCFERGYLLRKHGAGGLWFAGFICHGLYQYPCGGVLSVSN